MVRSLDWPHGSRKCVCVHVVWACCACVWSEGKFLPRGGVKEGGGGGGGGEER